MRSLHTGEIEGSYPSVTTNLREAQYGRDVQIDKTRFESRASNYMKYDPIIPKKELIDKAYYRGRCRNASYARWDAKTERFYYWRHKFGAVFIEEICCPEDDEVFDVFVAEDLVDYKGVEIRLP